MSLAWNLVLTAVDPHWWVVVERARSSNVGTKSPSGTDLPWAESVFQKLWAGTVKSYNSQVVWVGETHQKSEWIGSDVWQTSEPCLELGLLLVSTCFLHLI
jgi:hypothetical protein